MKTILRVLFMCLVAGCVGCGGSPKAEKPAKLAPLPTSPPTTMNAKPPPVQPN